jgi:hypothetical protein
MHTWLWNTGTDFYHSGLFKLMLCWQKWLVSSGDFME